MSKIKIYAPETKEYKILLEACNILEGITTEKLHFKVENVSFDMGQNWNYTTIICAEKGSFEYHFFTPRDYENLLYCNNSPEVLMFLSEYIKTSKILQKNLLEGPLANLNSNIKEWYMNAFPSDELGKEINPMVTFKKVYDNLQKVYELIEVDDSVIRERIFGKISEITNKDYDTIYNMWLGEE